jgi:pimeloyl-ACP methyl ester carboxylesterase
MISRRRFLAAATLPTVSLLSGCATFWDFFFGTCPKDPAETGGVDWVPSIMHPVFFGLQDLSAADGAPGAVRIFYPSYSEFPTDAPILKMCAVRWPLVLFFHGMPPQQCFSLQQWFKSWWMLPLTLARSGYVVVVPSYSPRLTLEPTFAATLIDWVRTSWVNAKWVNQHPEATALMGHSYGGVVASRAARARPPISAFVSLSAPFNELNPPEPANLLGSIGAPSMFMFSSENCCVDENLDHTGLTDVIPQPKHIAVFPGQHFDYVADIPDCSEPRGACPIFSTAAAQLVALFISRYMPVPVSQPHISVNLNPGAVTQTDKQRQFSQNQLDSNGRLTALNHFTFEGCRIDLRWVDGTETGSRVIGS